MPSKYHPTFMCAIVEVAPGKYEVATPGEVKLPGDKRLDSELRYPRHMYLLVGTKLDFGSLKLFKNNLERKIIRLEQELGMGPLMEDIQEKLDEFPGTYQTSQIQNSEWRQLGYWDFSLNAISIPNKEAEPTEPMLN